MATPSAGHRLVHINELLEMILLDFNTDQKPDIIALFSYMRVNRAFYSTIAGSKNLQQRLFLLPPILPPAQISQDPAMNLLINSSTVNKQLPDGSWASIGPCSDFHVRVNRFFPPNTATPANTEASWRRMYLRKTLHAIRWVELREWNQPVIIRRGHWVNPTMGELVDVVFAEKLRVSQRERGGTEGSVISTLETESRDRAASFMLRPLGT